MQKALAILLFLAAPAFAQAPTLADAWSACKARGFSDQLIHPNVPKDRPLPGPDKWAPWVNDCVKVKAQWDSGGGAAAEAKARADAEAAKKAAEAGQESLIHSFVSGN